jgi:hypothetical protein
MPAKKQRPERMTQPELMKVRVVLLPEEERYAGNLGVRCSGCLHLQALHVTDDGCETCGPCGDRRQKTIKVLLHAQTRLDFLPIAAELRKP